jgi:quercetin dioxygenase-like cupin family protein
MRPQATHEVLIDDDRVRVTRWDFAPGAETGWHRHGMDYVITTVTPCAFLLEDAEGNGKRVDLAAGQAYSRAEGVEHNVVNAGDAPMSFVEMEFK